MHDGDHLCYAAGVRLLSFCPLAGFDLLRILRIYVFGGIGACYFSVNNDVERREETGDFSDAHVALPFSGTMACFVFRDPRDVIFDEIESSILYRYRLSGLCIF